MLIVQQVALGAAKEVAKLMPRIKKLDRDLAIQLRRATQSVVLNTAEGGGNDPGTSRSRFFTAAGSAREVRAALQLSVVFGYITDGEAAPIDAALDRVGAMLHGLTRRG